MKIKQYRDLTVIDISSHEKMVISCDSCAGIGNKEGDLINIDPETMGYFTAGVALMELLSVGVKPITIINTLGVEMEDTGKEIIKGIRRALEPLEIKEDIVVTGSTEENIPVIQTSMGITAIGMIKKTDWKENRAEKRNLAVVLGLPKVGQEVLEDKGKETMSISILLDLIKNPHVKDILPVGSKGIKYELNQMAITNGLGLNIYPEVNVDIYKSAGPSTCVIVALDIEEYEEFKKDISIPVNPVGIFI